MTIAGHVTRFSRLLLAASVFAALQAGCGVHPFEFRGNTEGRPGDQIGTQADCIPRFPDAAGWLGGDAAYSVALPPPLATTGKGASVWLFGDTFVTRGETSDGRIYPFVHNTIGLSHCRAEGGWALTTYWQGRDEGPASAFFEPEPNAEWVRNALAQTTHPPHYWPFDGFVFDDNLFVGLLRVVHSEPRGPFNLPFRLAGMDLARIENPRDPPDRWRIQLSTLSEDPIAFPGSSFVVGRDYLYAFAFFDRDDGRSPRALTRIHLRRLRTWQPDLSQRLETLGPGGRWEDGFQPDRAEILMADDATEMSVHFDPSLERWLAVYATPAAPINPIDSSASSASSAIRMRSSRSLEGPWSPPQDLYTIPEMEPGADGRVDANIFCYAAKAHPQFAPVGNLLVTYVCNLFARNEDELIPVLERLANSPDLYRPIAVSLPIPPTLREGAQSNPARRRTQSSKRITPRVRRPCSRSSRACPISSSR